MLYTGAGTLLHGRNESEFLTFFPGLNKRSRNLLSICQDVRVVLTRLMEDEIIELTTRIPRPEPFPRDSGSTLQLPTLLPNTMYAYNTYLNNHNHYPEPVALSPQAAIPVIDLCSSDEESEAECLASTPLLSDVNDPLFSAGDECLKQTGSGEEVEPVFFDRNSTQNIEVYPSVETSYAHMGTGSCLNGDTFAVQCSSNPSLKVLESFPHDWQMNVSLKTVPSSTAPVFTSEERLTAYSSALHYNSEDTALPRMSNCGRTTTVQTKNCKLNSLSAEGLDSVVIEEVNSPMVHCQSADYLTLYNSRVSPGRTMMHTETKTQLSVPSFASTSLNVGSKDTKSPMQRPSFLAERRSCR